MFSYSIKMQLPSSHRTSKCLEMDKEFPRQESYSDCNFTKYHNDFSTSRWDKGCAKCTEITCSWKIDNLLLCKIVMSEKKTCQTSSNHDEMSHEEKIISLFLGFVTTRVENDKIVSQLQARKKKKKIRQPKCNNGHSSRF